MTKEKMSARDKALWYLGMGDKSIHQVREYLLKKEYEEAEAEEAVAWLIDKGFLDDERYAYEVFRNEYGKNRGKRRTVNYLRQKGVDSFVIEDAYYQFMDSFEGENIDERAMALELAQEMVRGLGADQIDEKMRAKVGRKLISRGFDNSNVYYCLSKLKEMAEE
ncbi:MAG: recombination regulator RecX [Clostridia bacterium]|nr:recombination regulator RecX [Clostridia bacterium]